MLNVVADCQHLSCCKTIFYRMTLVHDIQRLFRSDKKIAHEHMPSHTIVAQVVPFLSGSFSIAGFDAHNRYILFVFCNLDLFVDLACTSEYWYRFQGSTFDHRAFGGSGSHRNITTARQHSSTAVNFVEGQSGHIITKKRNRLSPESADNLIFLHGRHVVGWRLGDEALAAKK